MFFAAKLVKKLFTTKHLAKKELMKHFLLEKQKTKEIDMSIDVESLSEHEIDSIAVGYVFWVIKNQEN